MNYYQHIIQQINEFKEWREIYAENCVLTGNEQISKPLPMLNRSFSGYSEQKTLLSMQQQLDHFCPLYRKIYGDANSFHRSLSFFYLENLIQQEKEAVSATSFTQQDSRKSKISSLIIDIQDQLANLQDKINIYSIPQSLKSLLKVAHINMIVGILQILQKVSDEKECHIGESLREIFNTNPAFDLACILYMRCLVLETIQNSREHILEKYDSLLQSVRNYHSETADKFIIHSLAKKLTISIIIKELIGQELAEHIYSPNQSKGDNLLDFDTKKLVDETTNLLLLNQDCSGGGGDYQTTPQTVRTSKNKITVYLIQQNGCQFDLGYSEIYAKKYYLDSLAQSRLSYTNRSLDLFSLSQSRSVSAHSQSTRTIGTSRNEGQSSQHQLQSPFKQQNQDINQLIQLREQLAGVQDDKAKLLSERQQLKKQIEQLSQKEKQPRPLECNNEIEHQQWKESYETQLNALKDKVLEVTLERDRQARNLSEKIEQLQLLRAEAETVTTEKLKSQETTISNLEEVLKKIKQGKQQLNNELKESIEAITQLRNQLTAAQEVIIRLESEKQQMLEKLSQCVSKIQVLDSHSIKHQTERGGGSSTAEYQQLERNLQKEIVKSQMQENIIQQLKMKEGSSLEQYSLEKGILMEQLQQMTAEYNASAKQARRLEEKKKSYKLRLTKLSSDLTTKNECFAARQEHLIKTNERLLAESTLLHNQIQSLSKELEGSEGQRVDALRSAAECELRLKLRDQDYSTILQQNILMEQEISQLKQELKEIQQNFTEKEKQLIIDYQEAVQEMVQENEALQNQLENSEKLSMIRKTQSEEMVVAIKEAMNKQITENQQTIDQLKKEIETLRSSLLQKDNENTQLIKSHESQLNEQRLELQNKLKTLEEQNAAQLQEAQDKHMQELKQAQDFTIQLEKYLNQQKEAETQLIIEKRQLQLQYEQNIDQLRQDISQLMEDSNKTLEEQKQSHLSLTENYLAEINQLEKQVEGLQAQLVQYNKQREVNEFSRQDQCAQLEQQISLLIKSQAAVAKNLENCQQKSQDLKCTLDQEVQRRKKVETELDNLRLINNDQLGRLTSMQIQLTQLQIQQEYKDSLVEQFKSKYDTLNEDNIKNQQLIIKLQQDREISRPSKEEAAQAQDNSNCGDFNKKERLSTARSNTLTQRLTATSMAKYRQQPQQQQFIFNNNEGEEDNKDKEFIDQDHVNDSCHAEAGRVGVSTSFARANSPRGTNVNCTDPDVVSVITKDYVDVINDSRNIEEKVKQAKRHDKNLQLEEIQSKMQQQDQFRIQNNDRGQGLIFASPSKRSCKFLCEQNPKKANPVDGNIEFCYKCFQFPNISPEKARSLMQRSPKARSLKRIIHDSCSFERKASLSGSAQKIYQYPQTNAKLSSLFIQQNQDFNQTLQKKSFALSIQEVRKSSYSQSGLDQALNKPRYYFRLPKNNDYTHIAYSQPNLFVNNQSSYL